MSSRSLGHRAPLLWLVVPLIAGLVAGKLLPSFSPLWPLAGALIAAAFALLAAWRDLRGFTPALGAAMVLAGVASYALHRPRIAEWDWLPPREARLAIEIDRAFPSVSAKRATGLATIVRAEAPLQELVGQRIYYSVTLRPGLPAPIRSAVVSTLGVIAALPRDPPANSFDGYLANAGINFRFTRAQMLAEERSASAYRQFCARQAERFAAMLGAGVEAKRPALTGVLRAMLLGQQHELNDEQVARFRQSGTMHVFSISGLHIAVIAAALHALLLLLRLPGLIRCALGLVALWCYVEITGGVPSAVRAFVMVALVELSLVLRVPRNPVSALTASALLVILVAPLQVFSASFQMSYGIVAALLLLGLPLADAAQSRFALFHDLPLVTWAWHHRLRSALWHAALTALGIGLAASLISALTSVLFFELFTPGSLLANLWLIPASTAVILAGFVSLVCGLCGLTFGTLLANHAAVLLLWLIDAGVRLSAATPGMWFNASFRTPMLGGFALAATLAAMGWGYARGWRGAHRGFWLPFAVVAAALLLGVRFE